ncbi:unnamed protein product [Hermetia illucens]|uniref:Uncharacterized protein n=2 Tax=Hermetia illucens TaxID=343691 RepID=A0A7R8V6A8_HERIL|nr:unnamed protein product [Hermetia illucens]
MSKKLDFTNLAYREAVGRLKFLLEESYATPSKPTSQYRKHYVEDSGEDTDNQSQVTDRPPLSEISKYLSPNYKVQSAKKATPKSYSPHRSSRYSTTTDYAAPPPAPLSNETGQAPPEIISFIEKQEDYIEQLEKESKFCRDELSNLLGKVRDVISENEALTEHARSDLVASHPKISGSSESEDNHYEKIIRGRKDKPTRTSQALSGPSIVFESRISELEAELAQANIDLKKLRNENADLKRKSSLGTNAETGSFDSYRKRIESLERDKINLEETVKRLQLTIDDLRAEGNQVASKTQRSRDLADMALFEKSQAEIEIRRLKDELERQHERVRELQHEMSRRIADERANAERRYNYHVDQLDGDLSSQWEHASKLQLELERQKRLEIDFKRDLAQRNAQIEELKQELKDKKTTYLTDLAQVNAEKQALEQEITSLRLQLDKAERQGKIEAGRLNAEINSLRQRLDRADADILQVRRENLRLNDEIANLEKDLALGELKGEIRPTTKEINKSIVEMERKHADTVSELEEMIQSQRQLMDKLTAECRTLTSKLEESSLNHKMEISALQSNVEFLTNRIINSDRLGKIEPYSNLPSSAAPADYTSPTTTTQDKQPISIDTTAREFSPVTKPSSNLDYTSAYDSPKSQQPTPASTDNYRTAYKYGDEETEKDRGGKEYTESLREDDTKPYTSEPYSSLTNNQQPTYEQQPDPNQQYTEQQYEQPNYQAYDQEQYGETDYSRGYDQSYDMSQYQGDQQQYDDYSTSYQPETDLYPSNAQQSINYDTATIQPAQQAARQLSPPAESTARQLSPPTTSAEPAIPGSGQQSYSTPVAAPSSIPPTTMASPPGIRGSTSGITSNIESTNQPRKGSNPMGATGARNGSRGSQLLSQQSAEATKRIPTVSGRD